MSHQWRPITDLPVDWPSLASRDVQSIANIWQEQAETLQQNDAVKDFNERLAREWAIETGIIENVYQLDRGITTLLIERGFDAALIPYGTSDREPEEVIRIVQDHREALDGLFSFVTELRPLSKAYIRELHQQITAHQDTMLAKDSLGQVVDVRLDKGQFKKLPNNPSIPGNGLHEYCPPEQVESELDNLLAWHQQHESNNVPPDVEAAWFHHRFTQIHPFQDGNGRVARALASLILIKGKYFPLLITRDTRASYLDALAAADNDDLSPLVRMFGKIQKLCFRKALSLSENIIQDKEAFRTVLDAAIQTLTTRERDEELERRRVIDISRQLESVTYDKCQEVADVLGDATQGLRTQLNATAHRSSPDTNFWFKSQIVAVARHHEYFADTKTYRSWVSLRLVEDRTTYIVFTFHSVGTKFVGILGVNAFVEHRSRQEGEQESRARSIEGPYPVSADLFEFSYLELEEDVTRRFSAWLSETMTLALDQWRRQL